MLCRDVYSFDTLEQCPVHVLWCSEAFSLKSEDVSKSIRAEDMLFVLELKSPYLVNRP